MTGWCNIGRYIALIENYNGLAEILALRNALHGEIIVSSSIMKKMQDSTVRFQDIVDILGIKSAKDYIMATEDIILRIDHLMYEIESFLIHIVSIANYNIDKKRIRRYHNSLPIRYNSIQFDEYTKQSISVNYSTLAELVKIDESHLKNIYNDFNKRVPTIHHLFEGLDEFKINKIIYDFERSVKNKFRFKPFTLY